MSSKEAAHTWYIVIVVLAINEIVDLFALVLVAEEKTAQAVCLFAEQETRDASAIGWPLTEERPTPGHTRPGYVSSRS